MNTTTYLIREQHTGDICCSFQCGVHASHRAASIVASAASRSSRSGEEGGAVFSRACVGIYERLGWGILW